MRRMGFKPIFSAGAGCSGVLGGQDLLCGGCAEVIGILRVSGKATRPDFLVKLSISLRAG